MSEFRDEFARACTKIVYVKSIENLRRWVLPVFFSALSMNLNPKVAVVASLVPKTSHGQKLFLNLKSWTKREFEFDMGGAYV